MGAILIGDLMDSVRRPVEVVCKQKLDLAPIPHHKMVGKIVAGLDLLLLLENATGIHVRVSPIFLQDKKKNLWIKNLLAEICHLRRVGLPL